MEEIISRLDEIIQLMNALILQQYNTGYGGEESMKTGTVAPSYQPPYIPDTTGHPYIPRINIDTAAVYCTECGVSSVETFGYNCQNPQCPMELGHS